MDEQKIKAYWNRPGGPFKVIAGLAALGAVAYWVLPFLTIVVWNTINFGIACGVLGLLTFLATNKRVRLLVQSIWDIIMNNTFGLVFIWDPFVLWREDIKDMEVQREKCRQQAVDVDTQREVIQSKLEEKKKEMTRLIAKGQAAKKSADNEDLGLIAEQVQGYREYITKLTPTLDNLTKISTFLDKFDKNAGRVIEGEKTKLSLKIDLYKSATAGERAVSSSLRFFKGDPEKKLLLQQSADAYRQNVSSKLANMKKGLSLASDYMRSIDLDKAASEEQGLQMLSELDPDKGFSSEYEILDKFFPKEAVPVKEEVVPGQIDKNYYDNLLK